MIACLDHPTKRTAFLLRATRISGSPLVRNRGLRLSPQSSPLPSSATSVGPVLPLIALPGNGVAERNDIELTTYFHAPLERAYAAWRDGDMLPHFMRGVAGPCGADAPGWRLRLRDEDVPWEAVTTSEIPLQHIAWWSTGGRAHRNRGSVRFDAVGRKSTKVSVVIKFFESAKFAVTEGTLRSLRSAIDHSLDLLHLHLMPCSVLGPGPAPL